MIGARVKLSLANLFERSWGVTGTVIAETDDTVGVKLDKGPVPVIVRKEMIRVLTDEL